MLCSFVFFFFKQKTAYEMRISDWSSDVCSSDLVPALGRRRAPRRTPSRSAGSCPRPDGCRTCPRWCTPPQSGRWRTRRRWQPAACGFSWRSWTLDLVHHDGRPAGPPRRPLKCRSGCPGHQTATPAHGLLSGSTSLLSAECIGALGADPARERLEVLLGVRVGFEGLLRGLRVLRAGQDLVIEVETFLGVRRDVGRGLDVVQRIPRFLSLLVVAAGLGLTRRHDGLAERGQFAVGRRLALLRSRRRLLLGAFGLRTGGRRGGVVRVALLVAVLVVLAAGSGHPAEQNEARGNEGKSRGAHCESQPSGGSGPSESGSGASHDQRAHNSVGYTPPDGPVDVTRDSTLRNGAKPSRTAVPKRRTGATGARPAPPVRPDQISCRSRPRR